MTSPFTIGAAVWSPCNRFIAIKALDSARVCILDSATLQRLQSFEFKRDSTPLRSEALVFSPDSRMLTSFIRGGSYPDTGGFVVSWDLKTGGVVSVIEWKGPRDAQVGNAHITYSTDGRMVAVLPQYESFTIISIYDVVSGVHMHDADYGTRANPAPTSGVPHLYAIWTHGESIRFANPGPRGITIWEVGFGLGATPTEVETVSIPDDTVETFVFKPRNQGDIVRTQFHPSSCRLAFIGAKGALLVWDARASNFLLKHPGVRFLRSVTFSPDGRLFTCTTPESEIYLWKESPTGYTLFGKLTPSTQYSDIRFSPNGESVITFRGATIQLWHKKSFTTTSSGSTRPPQHPGNFLLGFLPDRPLAVVARKEGKTVTVLNLDSGVPQLIIDTPIEVYGLRPIENAIAVVGGEKAITWNLPVEHSPPGARVNVEGSAQTINFRNMGDSTVFAASISPDLRYVAIAGYCEEEEFLAVYSTSTGWNISGDGRAFELWFAPGGNDVWCATDNEAEVFTIAKDALDRTKSAVDIGDGSLGCPWGSSRGYKVTHDSWVLGADGKRLLMLPPLWQSQFKVDRVWNGKFLALLHDELLEPVILELEP